MDGTSTHGRVLVVDDEPAIVRAMQRWLGRRAEVIGTSDPFEGLRLAEDETFSLVLCDLNMPRLTGPEFVERLRACRPELATRVVIMTGSSTAETGQTRVLRKPLRPSDIEDLLRAG